jgi:hypothetical protein
MIAQSAKPPPRWRPLAAIKADEQSNEQGDGYKPRSRGPKASTASPAAFLVPAPLVTSLERCILMHGTTNVFGHTTLRTGEKYCDHAQPLEATRNNTHTF